MLRVLADSSDECLAFIAAVGIDRSIETTLTNNIVVVKDAEQARQFRTRPTKLRSDGSLKILRFLERFIDKGHRAIAPMSRNATEHSTLSLALLDGRDTRNSYSQFKRLSGTRYLKGPTARCLHLHATKDEEILKKAAEKRAKESGRSITVYRRLYPACGIATQPHWAKREEGLVPILGWFLDRRE